MCLCLSVTQQEAWPLGLSVPGKEAWSQSLSFKEEDATVSNGGVTSVQKGVASKSFNPVN